MYKFYYLQKKISFKSPIKTHNFIHIGIKALAAEIQVHPEQTVEDVQIEPLFNRGKDM